MNKKDDKIIQEITEFIMKYGVKIDKKNVVIPHSAGENVPENRYYLLTNYLLTTGSFSPFSNNNEVISIKFLNIQFNILDFLEAIGNAITLGYIIVSEQPVLAIVAFLTLIKQSMKSVTIEIGENESKIIRILWQLKKSEKEPTLENIIEKNKADETPLKKSEINKALENLKRLKCVELKNNQWILKEKVVIKNRNHTEDANDP